MSLNILLISDEMFKERTAIHGNIDPKLIYPDIKAAQDMYMHPILGTALYDKLLADVEAGTLAGNYKILVDRYIVDSLVYYTLSELPVNISYQFWNVGVARKQAENTELPSMEDLIKIADKFRQRAEFYANRLAKYLRQNAPTMFPEYINPGTGIDTIRPEHKPFSMPLWLGVEDKDCHKKSYEEKYQGNIPNCDCD